MGSGPTLALPLTSGLQDLAEAVTLDPCALPCYHPCPQDSSFAEVMAFLDEAEKYGKEIPTSFADGKGEARTVASESRMLKKMFLKLRD